MIVLSICLLFSCSSTKYVPAGEYLLDKLYIKTDLPDYGSVELKPYVKQIPNYKMFGINKTQLQIYNLSGKDSTKWLNRQLKKIGEPPVIFDSASVQKTAYEFRKFFINKGYLHVQVNPVVQKQNKKVNVTYFIQSNDPYRIRDIAVDIPDSALYHELSEAKELPVEKSLEKTGSLISRGMLFDRNILDSERERISVFLRNQGYYAFNKEYISYDVDSFSVKNEVNVKLKIHPYPEFLPSGMFIEVPHRRYFFNDIFIYQDYNPLLNLSLSDYRAADSIKLRKHTIYYKDKRMNIRPRVLLDNSFFTPGNVYAQENEEMTYSGYSSLQALNNVSIHFEEMFRNDSALLNAYILTTPAKRQGITLSLEGTNTAGDLGVASSVNYTHRNLFKGAENFNIKLRGAYEAISNNLQDYYLDLGAETSIRFPKFIFPFLRSSFKKQMRASTEFAVSYNYQTRPEYDRILISGGLRYFWQNRGKRANSQGVSQHQFRVLDLNYVLLPRMDSAFKAGLPKNAIYFSYNNQFVAGISYTYSHSSYIDPVQKQQRNAHSFRATLESAGNLLYLGSRLFNAPKDEENGTYNLFNTHFAQYVKGDIDYSKTIIIDKQNSIAWRIGGGIGLPYSNSKALPFEKRYYSGGANSVRAWSVRTLGPGSYQPADTTTFYEQSGDIKLDLSIEYRSRLFWKLETAVFIDGGNIWTLRNLEDQRNGQFKFNKFYKEIAIGYGLGLRLNFDYFVVRLDGAWKAYNPEKRGSKRWSIVNPNFKNNFAWHFAVGYPF